MLGTLASFLLVLGAAFAAGQAVLAACGRREWWPLAPAIGLAVLCALAWWTVRLPGEGAAAAIALGVLALACLAFLRARVVPPGPGVREGAAIALAAALLAALPFVVEMRFGILGTGLNPDMSQHLFAADRLSFGGSERLIAEGYPLGPHAIVVALSALGPSLVHGFGGLTLAIAAAACLAPLALLGGVSAWRRSIAALCIGLAYLVAVFLVQGAFKEALQALFLVAFAIALALIARRARAGEAAGPADAVIAALPAVGSAYVYSFPGLLWLIGAVGAWKLLELGAAWRRAGAREAWRLGWRAAPVALVGAGVVLVALAPELARMRDFASFETFDPDGDGLGNLFNRLSPLEALGIWPSGDFRVEPGDGAVPAIAFYLGGAAGLAALGYGLRDFLRRGELAALGALGAAVALWLYALLAGTPYQEAKALVLVGAVAAVLALVALARSAPAWAFAVFALAAGGSSLLALVNGQVGPGGYSPQLGELRTELGPGATVVTAPPELLADQHGRDYLVWELRGNRVCVTEPGGEDEVDAFRVIAVELGEDGAVVPASVLVTETDPAGEECPFIPDGAAADPAGDG